MEIKGHESLPRHPAGQFKPHDYPPHWGQLCQAALARDANRCACLGECGHGHQGSTADPERCGAPNRVKIVRGLDDKARWWFANHAPREVAVDVPVEIVLTTAHLCQESRCEDLAHLRMLCQFCHLNLDKRQHARNARATRRLRRGPTQLSFFAMED